MRLIIGGARGTSVVADPAFLEFGGDTTSFLVEGDRGDTVLIDAGTGTRLIDRYVRMARRHDLLLLMTHYHQDHLIGFPGFTPIYDATWSIEIDGPEIEGFTPEQVFSGMLGKPFWPLQIEGLQADIRFVTLPNQSSPDGRVFGDLVIRWCPVHHLGNCLAYRIDEQSKEKAIIIATDIEWSLATDIERKALIELCTRPYPAHLLIFDAHFTPEEYPRFKGWGHSTWRDALDVVRQTHIERLVLTHYSQYADDLKLLDTENEIKKIMPSAEIARGARIIAVE